MGVLTENGTLAKELLDEYMQAQTDRPAVFGAFLHMDEATPHLHIDFVPYVCRLERQRSGYQGSLKQA